MRATRYSLSWPIGKPEKANEDQATQRPAINEAAHAAGYDASCASPGGETTRRQRALLYRPGFAAPGARPRLDNSGIWYFGGGYIGGENGVVENRRGDERTDATPTVAAGRQAA